MREGGKKTKKTYILSLEMNLFFAECFFDHPKLTVFFKNRQYFDARAGEEKKHRLFW